MSSLLAERWKQFDSNELQLLLGEQFDSHGQYDETRTGVTYCLPSAGASCQIELDFSADGKLKNIRCGQAFDSAKWERIKTKIDHAIEGGEIKIGRDYSFSSARVEGSWRGALSRVQILPPPDDAPRAPSPIAEHPFILEFPFRTSDSGALTNRRRIQDHRKHTMLLNVLLNRGISFQSTRSAHFWANVPDEEGFRGKWAQRFFPASVGLFIVDDLSTPASAALEVVAPEDYYSRADNDPLRVPADLDESICRYRHVPAVERNKFELAIFWLDKARRLFDVAVSSSFIALVTAAESMTKRGVTHRSRCDECGCMITHDEPGATKNFKVFFETYAPDSTPSMRERMYRLRSGIAHGTQIMRLDQDIAYGWDPTEWSQTELHWDLWNLTRTALRNWLKMASTTS